MTRLPSLFVVQDKNKSLFKASGNGNRNKVLRLLDDGASIEVRNKNGETPLHYAFRFQRSAVVEALLARGAYIDAQDNHGWTPLHHACLLGNSEAVKVLITEGADIQIKDYHGKTPLDCAKSHGKEAVMKLLTTHLARIKVENNRELLKAAENGDKGKVIMLLAKGADIETRDINRETPLHYACFQGNVEVVEALLTKGANIEARATNGWTPLLCACYMGKLEVVETLLAKGCLGIDVEARGKYGETPLHNACETGRLGVVTTLLNYGVNIEARDNRGEAPLHRACRFNEVQVVEALITEGADIEARDNDGWTPLHRACEIGKAEMVEMLLVKGASVRAMNNDGKFPLDLSESRGRGSFITSLIIAYSNSNVKLAPNKTMQKEVTSKDDAGEMSEKTFAPNYLNPDRTNDAKKQQPIEDSKNGSNYPDAMLLLSDASSEQSHKNDVDVIAVRDTKQSIQNSKVSVEEASTLSNGDAEERSSDIDEVTDATIISSNFSTQIAEDSRVDESFIAAHPTVNSANHINSITLTNEDILFLKEGQQLLKDGGNIPQISEEERLAIQMLTTSICDFERSLESVRELPPALVGRSDEISTYFFFFTNAFERTFVAARAISTGAVALELGTANGILQKLLCGASWVGEKSQLPFVGCISIFSAIIMYQKVTKKTNAFKTFEDFFRGSSRDQYLLTYRKLAEQICLQLDFSSLEKNDLRTMESYRKRVNEITEPVQKHLRKVHLLEMNKLTPVESRALIDLSSITKEVLRLHQHELRTYRELCKSDESTKASYFIRLLFDLHCRPDNNSPTSFSTRCIYKQLEDQSLGQKNTEVAKPTEKMQIFEKQIQILVEDNKRLTRQVDSGMLIKQVDSNISSHDTSIKTQLATRSPHHNENYELANQGETIHILEKQIQSLIKQIDDNANMANDLLQIKAKVLKLESEVKCQKDLTVQSGRQAQILLNPSRPLEEIQQLEQLIYQIINDLQKVLTQQDTIQKQQEKQCRELEKIKLDNFISNRILTRHEAYEFTETLLTNAFGRDGKHLSISVAEDGRFQLNGKEYCIGQVRRGSKKKMLWKGKVDIKLEERHNEILSVMDWFDQTKLRPIYERNKKQTILLMFKDELNEPYLSDIDPLFHSHNQQDICDEIFDTNSIPNLR